MLKKRKEVLKMKWSEVRAKYPNKFIKFAVLDSHIEGDVEIVDAV